MPSFQTPLQRFITSGQLALWVLGLQPLFYRLLLSLLPDDGDVESLFDLDASTLGWLLVLGVLLHIARFAGALFVESTLAEARPRWTGRWSYRFWLGTLCIVAYVLATQTLPLWVALLLDLGILAIVVRYGRTRAKELIEDLAYFTHWHV